MQTSNFKIAGHLENAVAICRMVPRNFKGRCFRKLAPPWNLIKENRKDVFEAGYYDKVLSSLDPEAVYRELGNDAILLCYENPGEFCHRRTVAEWLENALGILVPEYEPKPIKTGVNLRLF